MIYSQKDISDLHKTIIGSDFIPENYNISNVVSDDLMIVSWDLNNRSPRFFTKKSEKFN
jgi:hypothetical protein